MAIRILVADDHGILRASLKALLSTKPDLEVVGEAADGHEVLERARERLPDVVLLDLSMPGPGGIETLRRLKEQVPQARVAVLTIHEDESLLQECIRVGAAGYIIKRASDTELVDAIRAVHQGHIYIHPAMTRALLEGRTESRPAGKAPAEALTPRESEVLRGIAEGYTSRQLAELWTISVRTVESHRANLMSKLNLRSRAELVRYAREHNYL